MKEKLDGVIKKEKERERELLGIQSEIEKEIADVEMKN